jgi:hypothetical protein
MMVLLGQLKQVQLTSKSRYVSRSWYSNSALEFMVVLILIQEAPEFWHGTRRMDRCRSSNKNNNGKLIWQII